MPIPKDRFEDRPEERPLIPPHSGHAPAPVAAPATGQTQSVVVQGQPLASTVTQEPERDSNSPYESPSEFKEPGGVFIVGAKLKGNKLYGGRVVNAQGELLATFKNDQENTGRVEDGEKPEAEH